MAVAACASLIMTSCGKKNDTSAETVEVTETETLTVPVINSQQHSALVSAGLLSEEDFSMPVFIDFNATWCGPCRQFTPYFEAAAEKYGEHAKFIPVDVDIYGDVASAFGVERIPMVVIILPSGEYVTYNGTQDIVGEGLFDSIVESCLD